MHSLSRGLLNSLQSYPKQSLKPINNTRVAVLGAGISGCLTALRLAEAGAAVDLYEQNSAPLQGASLNNEGKLHLGFVFANDPSQRTLHSMLQGALSFSSLLSPWMSAHEIELATSEPFFYAVHRDSMLDVARIEHHFAAVERTFRALAQNSFSGYPGLQNLQQALWRRLSAGEHQELFDEQRVVASYATEERALDPRLVAQALTRALHHSPRIQLRLRHRINAVKAHKSHYEVHGYNDEDATSLTENYDQVVNALWQNRVAIDASLGLQVQQPLIHRYKIGLNTPGGCRPASLPSVTFVLGSFGDTVAYRDRAYLSWYPSGMVSQQVALAPATELVQLDSARLEQITRDSLNGIAALFKHSSDWDASAQLPWQVAGGFITAWGSSGIEDAGSQLHQRHAIGPHSEAGYHSIDTGKYTTAPWFAAEVCERVVAAATALP